MKRIELTQGQFALVDDADYNWLNQWKWCVLKIKGNFYARRASSIKSGKRVDILMHRQILGLKPGDKRQGDHIDHNTLDNRRSNIRLCSCQENQRNRKPRTDTTSDYKGVSWYKRLRKWQAHIQVDGKRKHLGFFNGERDAAFAYNKAAGELFGDYVWLNPI